MNPRNSKTLSILCRFQISTQQQLGPPNMTPLGPPPNMTPLGPPPNMTPLGPPPNMTPQHVPQYHNLTPQISQHQPMQHIQMQVDKNSKRLHGTTATLF